MTKHQPHRRTFATLLAACSHVKKKKRFLISFHPHPTFAPTSYHNLFSIATSHYKPMCSPSPTSINQYLPTLRLPTNNKILSVQPYALFLPAKPPMILFSPLLFLIK